MCFVTSDVNFILFFCFIYYNTLVLNNTDHLVAQQDWFIYLLQFISQLLFLDLPVRYLYAYTLLVHACYVMLTVNASIFWLLRGIIVMFMNMPLSSLFPSMAAPFCSCFIQGLHLLSSLECWLTFLFVVVRSHVLLSSASVPNSLTVLSPGCLLPCSLPQSYT